MVRIKNTLAIIFYILFSISYGAFSSYLFSNKLNFSFFETILLTAFCGVVFVLIWYLIKKYIKKVILHLNVNRKLNAFDTIECLNNNEVSLLFKMGIKDFSKKTIRHEGYKSIKSSKGDSMIYVNPERFERKDCKLSLSNVILKNCNLNDSTFEHSNFDYANFENSLIGNSRFDNTSLIGSNFNNSNIDDTVFSNSNLTNSTFLNVKGLDTVYFKNVICHNCCFPVNFFNFIWSEDYVQEMHINLKTFHYSNWKIEDLKNALEKKMIIIDELNIDELNNLQGMTTNNDKISTILNRKSVFISYGSPDEYFANLLNTRLEQNGVRTFLFSKHAIPGQKLYKVMSDGINSSDIVILICSKNSLERTGVLNELRHALSREAREGGSERIIPVVIDDYLFTDWNPSEEGLRLELEERVVSDFRNYNQDFDDQFNKLINALSMTFNFEQ